MRAEEPTRWERAYQAFETPQEEFRKFARRLRAIGAGGWNKDGTVLEVCCGRGNALRAWRALGFRRVLGLDSSRALVRGCRRDPPVLLADVRAIPLASGSCGIVAVQGGLHHLARAADVAGALAEMRRVAQPNGRIVIVEPWLTPFLRFVHRASREPLVRRLSAKVDAFAIMTEEERSTYERWLAAREEDLRLMLSHVEPEILRRRWGKLTLVGAPKKLPEAL